MPDNQSQEQLRLSWEFLQHTKPTVDENSKTNPISRPVLQSLAAAQTKPQRAAHK